MVPSWFGIIVCDSQEMAFEDRAEVALERDCDGFWG
jgi:hypothetical protein